MPAGTRTAADEWDARAELDVAIFIERYLAERPPPAASELEADLKRWARQLRTDGEQRLWMLGASRLTTVRREATA
jgi:hypothetical protein